ncbi:MAG: ATP-dependent helicase [Dehalococcoidia bacterium]|nr:ATP-dependent DNA helicase PcrA [Chloroflexota bacterium]MBT9161929.1 ATP-dependent DNA helicase PcrA [Chloroflexota bacterium]
MDILAGLNPAQRAAVECVEGPQLVVAGPGSGKTRVIVHRIAYLIKVCDVSPHRIMAVTFTNKAAREMKERVCRMLGDQAEGITLGTFHAICARILRREADHIGFERRFVIYDDADQMSLIGRCIKDLSLDPRQNPPRAIKSAISSAKARLLGPKEYVSRNYFEEVSKRVYELYQRMLIESRALDFDDLLMQTVRLFRDHHDVLSEYQSRYLHVMIDEFQDTNLAQYTLASQLAGKHRNLCAVGDPDQSIYSWRFADLRHIMDFERDYQDARVVFLEQNYRSTQTILAAASHLISRNERRREKALYTQNDGGVPIGIVETYDEQEEAQFVVGEVERLISDHGHSAGDCAVMYRTNAQSRALEEAFVRYGLPYKLVGATRFFERREVKDIISYLRVINNPYDSVSLARIINVPPRGIGQRTMARLSEWSRSKGIPIYSALKLIANGEETAHSPRSIQIMNGFTAMVDELISSVRVMGYGLGVIGDAVAPITYHPLPLTSLVGLFDMLLERIGYKKYILDGDEGDERWSNVLELRGMAGEYNDLEPQDALAALLERVVLVSDVDDLAERVEAVTLITLHQAKGLEFPVVFIVGMEEGILPHFRSFADPEQMEEERRLCYVGITRAKARVYLVHAFRRGLHGRNQPNPPSPFLKDIPAHLVVYNSNQQIMASRTGILPVICDSGEYTQPVGARCNVPLQAGDRVHHTKFGDGVVVNSFATSGDHEVSVAFRRGVGVKRLLVSLAPLERLS